MPATSEAALDRQKKVKREREASRRQSYRSSQEDSIHLELDRKFTISTQTDLTKFDSIDHIPVGEDSKCLSGRPNLTVADRKTEEIILQRISPTSYDKMLETRASAEAGRILFDQYLDKKTPGWTIQRGKSSAKKLKITINKRKVIEHHLGIWHSRGKNSLDFTKETTFHRYKEEALELLDWARQHTDLVMKTAKASIHPSFRSNIKARSKGRKWLTSIFGERSIELLHPWWTTIAFFSNFAGGIHVDQDDCIPSFLFNFGEPAWIELPEYSVKVLVEPLELVILNSRTFYHRTRPFDPFLHGSSLLGYRWAFSGFFRDGIFNREPVSKVAKWRLDAIFKKQS